MRNIITILLLLLGFESQAQTGSLKIEKKTFQSMQIIGDRLLALDEGGRLSVWDTNSLQKIYSSKDTIIQYSSIGVDKNNEVFLGSKNGKLYKLNSTDFTTELYMKLKNKYYVISEILFNSSNELFLILPYGIYDPINDVLWKDFEHKYSIRRVIERKRFLLFFHKKIFLDKYFAYPDYSFFDSNDMLWMSTSEGEFGSELQVFDAKKKVIVKRDYINKSQPYGNFKSGFESEKGDIFITSETSIFNVKNFKSCKIFDNTSVEGSAFIELNNSVGDIVLI